MKKYMLGICLIALVMAGCSTDADVASRNLSVAAEQFEIERRVVFFNGITDAYLLSIEGRVGSIVDNPDLEGSRLTRIRRIQWIGRRRVQRYFRLPLQGSIISDHKDDLANQRSQGENEHAISHDFFLYLGATEAGNPSDGNGRTQKAGRQTEERANHDSGRHEGQSDDYAAADY